MEIQTCPGDDRSHFSLTSLSVSLDSSWLCQGDDGLVIVFCERL